MISKLIRNKLLKETAWSLLAKATAFLFFIGLNIFLARWLGPDRFGAWSYYYSILNIVLLLSYFGINGSTRKFVAQYNNTSNLGSVLKSSIRIRILYSILFALLFLFVHKSLAVILDRPDFELMFLLAVPFIFFAGIVDFFRHAFEGLHRLKYYFYITLSEHGLKFIFALVILLFIDELAALIFSFNLALLITLFVGTYYYYMFYIESEVSSINFNMDILKYSIPLFIINIGFAVAVELDLLMIGLLSSDSEVGVYAVAKQIIVKLPHLALAISMGTMPLFAKFNASNKKELTTLFYQLIKTNSVVFGLIGLLIMGTGWLFIPLIFGEEYKASVVPLMILVVYLILFSYSVYLSTFLDYQGKAQKRAVNLSITIFLNVLLNSILIPRFGATGAAIGTSISYMPYFYLNWREVRKYLK